ncbi:macro domain-containing protein [Priestia aryabhattai]|uniref:macro domain-containing protein n=1 Tax=Priestia aryabhattai TaxID=412384 RepID=UPI0015F64195|nr:macro domain-containing protein [Priestia aryabhattai]
MIVIYTIVKGDILKAKENIIVHQVNAQGKFGAGIAGQIRKKYPVVYEKYIKLSNHYSQDKKMLLGKTQIIKVEDNKYIANIFGQLTYGRAGVHTDYTALKMGLSDLKIRAKKHSKTVAIPRFIGSGLGGGDANLILKMIDEIFSDYEVTLYEL